MPTVLLVENEPVLLANLRYELERSGYTVLAANSGEAAARIAHHYAGPIDVLVSDVAMSPMTGFELAAIIKSTHPKAIVILMSGSLACGFPQRTIVGNFLQKPFPHRDLLAAISRHSQKRATTGEGHEN